ncbi:MAG TPA: alginate lyase family protein [Phycisphaerae bacterium]|nr:alginate lyase family protein [Phycisphaerae bacterium]HRY70021.1 alginate lyase family protein [Phycisphaerae bacterium]HSA27229.1 alginate lyase family protein [Phycisphaerae bacterium]
MMGFRWIWLCTAVFCIPTFVLQVSAAEMVPYTQRWDVKLKSLSPEDILSKLDLTAAGLEAAKAAAERGNRTAALSALREYYRKRYPLAGLPAQATGSEFQTADQVINHVFQWGPYEPADYGKDVDWKADPRGDIEWVAAVYRFHWADPLARAYAATRDDKYARAFVELTTDWIRKYPLENWTATHPVYKSWRGFAWLDLQTGIRAGRMCNTFKVLVHSDAFTPEFLGVLLASLYDHQVKTWTIPMGMVHNKAIFEQRGFVNVATTFPEFKESRGWIELGLERARENLLEQVTADGVQREWCGGYHLAVLNDAVDIMNQAESAGVRVPDDYRRRVRAMYDYIFGIATPDLGFPMFGDAARPLVTTQDRSRWPLYSVLLQASTLLGDPKYGALARLDQEQLPTEASAAFRDAGLCVMRSGWEPDQIYLAMHCPPPGISGHDQPDNGTFELWAYGRWLMTDTGFYTYGHDAAARAWHRRTRVHQTLTLDDKDSRIKGALKLWSTSPTCDAVVFENEAYSDLLHRRSVWFVDHKLFVILDEAIGAAAGRLDLHFQLAAGDAALDEKRKLARTGFDDANVLVWTGPDAPVTMEEEEGWFAWEYGQRKPRKAFRYRHASGAPARFLTALVPYRGTQTSEVSAVLAPGFALGSPEVEIAVEAFGRHWHLGRNLLRQEAWCREARSVRP